MYNSAGGYTDNFYCLFTDNKKEKIILKFLGYFEWMVNYSICRTENIKNVMQKSSLQISGHRQKKFSPDIR